jgi:hypothetical protein
MKLSESIVVSKEYRIFELIWRGYYYSDKSPCGKKSKARFQNHSDKCFDAAHRLFRKHNRENNLGWKEWQITINPSLSNSSFYMKNCTFNINKVN